MTAQIVTAEPIQSQPPAKKRAANPRTKTQKVLGLLKRPNGASIPELQKSTGWQSHTVRAALSGLRKKGCAIDRGTDDKGKTRYRLLQREG
ncbi:MAG: DUF3489 domain-containing protein [Magnetospiraceae bacterium]